VSISQTAAVSLPRGETRLIASLLAPIGGYLDAYAWIVHRTFANTQTANLVFRVPLRAWNGSRHRRDHDGSDAGPQPRHSGDTTRGRVVALRARSNGRQEVAVVVHVGDLI
jgi:hypothetical protein